MSNHGDAPKKTFECKHRDTHTHETKGAVVQLFHAPISQPYRAAERQPTHRTSRGEGQCAAVVEAKNQAKVGDNQVRKAPLARCCICRCDAGRPLDAPSETNTEQIQTMRPSQTHRRTHSTERRNTMPKKVVCPENGVHMLRSFARCQMANQDQSETQHNTHTTNNKGSSERGSIK